MTDLQVTITNLKAVCFAANLVLERLEKAQKDLEKPPPHKWEHGDVFENEWGVTMIYITSTLQGRMYVYCISGSCDCFHKPENFLSTGKFLFNIKEKL